MILTVDHTMLRLTYDLWLLEPYSHCSRIQGGVFKETVNFKLLCASLVIHPMLLQPSIVLYVLPQLPTSHYMSLPLSMGKLMHLFTTIAIKSLFK